MTHFGVGTAELLGAMGEAPAPRVVGVDWRTTLTDAATRVPPGTALQGNLDPVVLLAGWHVVEQRGPRRGRGRPPRGRRGCGRPRLQPRARRAARHRPGSADRPRRAGAFAVRARDRSYCVVGGGISGLTAAYRLRVAVGDDATITVFDPADRLGGVLRTEQVGGQPLDIGAEAFVARRPEVPALLAELGLAERRDRNDGCAAADLQRGPAASAAGRHRQRRSEHSGVDGRTGRRATVAPDGGGAVTAVALAPGCATPSVAEVVGDRFGPQVVARSVDPMLAGVYAGSAATIGMRSAVPTVAAALDRGAPQPDRRRARPRCRRVRGGRCSARSSGGYQVLLDALVTRSGLRVAGHGGRRPGAGRRGWSLRDDEGAHWHADAVVLALPAPRLARLVERGGSAHGRGRAPDHDGVVGGGGAGGARRDAAAAALRCAGRQRRTRCTPRRSRCRHANGVPVATSSWCGCRSAGSATTIARERPTTTCWRGRLRDLADVFGIDVDPVDCQRAPLVGRDAAVRPRPRSSWWPNCGPGCRRGWRWRAATSTVSACPPASPPRAGRPTWSAAKRWTGSGAGTVAR